MSAKSLNQNLHAARAQKMDEFYTQLADIENELKGYAKHFKGKTVYCNCDDPSMSNFFHYFFKKFEQLKLKRLITTCYKSQSRDLFSQNDAKKAIYLEYTGSKGKSKEPNPDEISVKPLKSDGDFRSKECIALLKQADIVVTNPPFSLFREYVAQLIKHGKMFVIIGNKNAISYKEIFSLIKENKMWVGMTPMSADMLFDVPKGFARKLVSNKKEGSAYKIVDGSVKGRAQAVWFTNLDIAKRHEELLLSESYKGNESAYPNYDNYNAINVDKTLDIPDDYKGTMGVPITFLDKYNPEQFDILGSDYEVKEGLLPEMVRPNWKGKVDRGYLNGKRKYARIFIRRKNYGN